MVWEMKSILLLYYLDYVVNIIPHIDWLVFTHSSGCGFLFLGTIGGIFSLGKMVVLFLVLFCLRKSDNNLLVFVLRKTSGSILGVLFCLRNTGDTLLV